MNRAERRKLARDISEQAARGAVDLTQLSQHAGQPEVIYFGYIAGENVRTLWHQSMLDVAFQGAQHGFLLRPKLVESGSHLSLARNIIVDRFLNQSDDEHLLFCDTDMVFSPQDVALLLKADAPIAGALYFTAATGTEPWPAALDGPDEAGNYLPIDLPEPPEDFDEHDPESLGEWIKTGLAPRVVATPGTGLMLIKREVLIDVSSAYDGRPFEFAEGRGEDLTFCLRAAELGYESTLVPAARVGHVKAMVL